jgi:Tfp pilus assembly protein FimT
MRERDFMQGFQVFPVMERFSLVEWPVSSLLVSARNFAQISLKGFIQRFHAKDFRSLRKERFSGFCRHRSSRSSFMFLAKDQRGFTTLELAFTVAVAMILTTISVPMTKSALKTYHLNSAVSAISGAIQSTRYQAISHGYHYNISFDPGSQSYQLAAKVPPATAFSNVGTAVPWCPSGDVTISPSTTLEFFPGGMVSATTGSMTFSVSNGTTTKTITVSGVGNVSVTP